MRALILLVLLFVMANSFAGELKWNNFDDGLAEAKKTKRKIIVDVYTNWCSWCKVMDSKTYANKGISDYLSQRYVLIKLNAESTKKLTYKNQQYTEQELASAFGISGYPSTLFLKSDGEPITVYPGYAEAEKFKTVLSFIAEDHYLTKKFEEYAIGK